MDITQRQWFVRKLVGVGSVWGVASGYPALVWSGLGHLVALSARAKQELDVGAGGALEVTMNWSDVFSLVLTC